MRGSNWPITANCRIWKTQGRALVALEGVSEWFLHKTLQAPKKKKNQKQLGVFVFFFLLSDAGCQWLDPTLEHTVVPVFSSPGCGWAVVKRGPKNRRKTSKLTTGYHWRRARATNDQWSFPFSFRLPRKHQIFSSNKYISSSQCQF